MKKRRFCILMVLFQMLMIPVIAQLPGGPPDPPGIAHGIGGDQLAGGSAPLGGGSWLLITLALIYITIKLMPLLRYLTLLKLNEFFNRSESYK